jgi:hypothetical protein
VHQPKDEDGAPAASVAWPAVRAETETVLEAAPSQVVAVLADLATWPAWLDVVVRAEPDGRGAWRVRLGLSFGRASVGYDVRMVRVTAPPGLVGPEGHKQSPAGSEGHKQSPAGSEGHNQSPAGSEGHKQSARLRFERDEADGRDGHSMVVIDVGLVSTGARTTATLRIEIDKRIPLLDLQRQLDRRAEGATRRLQRLLDER